ncbi:MAG: PD40 domain-containing protein [Planctomycetes bacterium]|nr:PD40 domain-containing protein [Planctomycetota bacterium]
MVGCIPGLPPTPPRVQPVGQEARHLRNLRQLTFGGENAEAYFSWDGKRLVFQSTRDGGLCDQIYTMRVDGSGVRMVSTGQGRATCSFFVPGDERILYSSTHLAGPECPPEERVMEGKYVWAVHASFDIFSVRADGRDLRRLTEAAGYDAEATVSRNGRVVFTSARDGDLELYSMNADGSEPKRLTFERGYDGGAFFSPDARRIVYRADHPKTAEELEHYERFLARGYVQPEQMELFIMDADGSNRRQITSNGRANFCPFFHPSGAKIIFSANLDAERPRNFDLYQIGVDGTGLERVTWDPTFDGFPMFSPDGKKLVFASNRNARSPGETNLFLADWKEE